MLARLILTLLLAAFAFPATASMPCHDGGAPMAMAMPAVLVGHHMMPATPVPDDRSAATHSCAGCIPPSSLRVAAVVPVRVPLTERPLIAVARLDLHGAPAPATPPPRIAV